MASLRPKASQDLPPRLSKRGQFLYVQSRGRRVKGRCVTLLLAPAQPVPAAHAQVGYTVSRRVGGAVVRNRVRRRLREAVRLDPHPLDTGSWYVLIAHPQAALQPTADLTREVTWLLAKARQHMRLPK